MLVPPAPDALPQSAPPSSSEFAATSQQTVDSNLVPPSDVNRSADIAASDESRLLARSGFETVELSRMAIYTIGGLIIAMSVVSFPAWLEFRKRTFEVQDDRGASASRKISGRITYVTQRGKLAPDSEAVVVAFSTQRKPDQKIDPVELRPDVAPADVSARHENAVRALAAILRGPTETELTKFKYRHPANTICW